MTNRTIRALTFVLLVAIAGPVLLVSILASNPTFGITTFSVWTPPPKAGGYTTLEWSIQPEMVPTSVPKFWAHRFSFEDGSGALLGLQNLASDPEGKIVLFSIFDSINVSGPQYTANFGGGYTARIQYDWQPNRTYTFKVFLETSEASGDWWRVDITDVATGAASYVGSIQVPSAWKGLAPQTYAYTDSYGSTPTCAEQQPGGALFYTPLFDGARVSNLPQNVLGSQSEPGKTFCPSSYSVNIPGGVRHWVNVSSPPPNTDPTANAGADQTLTDSDGDGSVTLMLDGSGSQDIDGVIANYTWRHGSQVLTSGLASNPTIVLQADATYTLQLEVTDDRGGTDTDSVAIAVLGASTPPGGGNPPPPPPGGDGGIVIQDPGEPSESTGELVVGTPPQESQPELAFGLEDPFGQFLYPLDENGNETLQETAPTAAVGQTQSGSSAGSVVLVSILVTAGLVVGVFAIRRLRSSEPQLATMPIKPPAAPKKKKKPKKAKKKKNKTTEPTTIIPVVKPPDDSKGMHAYPWLPESDPERDRYFPQ